MKTKYILTFIFLSLSHHLLPSEEPLSPEKQFLNLFKTSDLNSVEKFLEQHPDIDINTQDEDGRTALHLMYTQEYKKEEKKQVCKIAKMLLQRGANPNLQENNTFGNTPLHYAYKSDKASLTKILINNNEVEVDKKSKYGDTALHMLCYLGYNDKKKERKACQLATLLIQKGANPNLPNIAVNATPLHHACIYNTPSLIEILINNGSDVNKQQKHGNTALHLICGKSKAENKEKKRQAYQTAKMLIEKGANPNLQSSISKSIPLHYACEFNHKSSLIKMLINNGSNYTIQDEQALTPYQHLSKPSTLRNKFSQEALLMPSFSYALFDNLATSLLPEIADIIKSFYFNLWCKNMRAEAWIWEPVCIEACEEAYKKDKVEFDNVKDLQQCHLRIVCFWSKAKKIAINTILHEKEKKVENVLM